jgi:glycosyltransferase involved in cell wall biosynthesis
MVQLTIGMPLYNNAKTLPAALDCLLAQTFADFRIVASDDASTDGTVEVLQRYAARDSRIDYVRQAKNLGYAGNYLFVAELARTPFFMWAAGDDRWAPRFVAENVAALTADATLAASVSRIRFTHGDEMLGLATGTYPITGTPAERLARFLAGCANADLSRLFAVYRTSMLRAAFPIPQTSAFDAGLCAVVALQGGYHEVPEVLLWRDRTPVERYVELMRKEAVPGLAGCFPGLLTTRWLLRQHRIPLSRDVVLALIAFNVDWHLAYTARYHPRYAALTRPLRWVWETHLDWRLRRPLHR